jgi:hypothetical protein
MNDKNRNSKIDSQSSDTIDAINQSGNDEDVVGVFGSTDGDENEIKIKDGDSDGDSDSDDVCTDDDEYDFDYVDNSDDNEESEGGYDERSIMDYKIRLENEERDLRFRLQSKLNIHDEDNDKVEDKSKSKSSPLSLSKCSSMTLYSASASFGVLFNDLCRLRRNEMSLGYECTPVDDDIYKWNIKMHQFRPDSDIFMDMTMLDDLYGYSYVEFEGM